MSDIDVVAVLKAKDGEAARLQAALEAFVVPTREEPGCISYLLFQSQSEAGTFVTVEKWSSQQDVDGHMTAPHMAQFYTDAGDTLDEAPAVHQLTPLSPAG